MPDYKSSENYAAISQALGQSTEQEIDKVVVEHYGLLPKSSAVNLLAARLGVLKRRKFPLSGIPSGSRNFDTVGIIEKIYPTFTPPPNSKAPCSVRLVLCEPGASAQATAVLWDENSTLVQGTIGIGDKVELQGAYFRNGEVNIGTGGRVVVIEKVPLSGVKNLKYGLVNIKGIISEIFPDSFFMKNGKKDAACSFKLAQQEGSCTVVAWSDLLQVKRLSIGDQVLCENCLCKNSEVHLNAYSRLIVLEAAQPSYETGTIKSVEEAAGLVVAAFEEGTKAVFSGAQALLFLGISALPDGISLSAACQIKSPSMLGMKVKYKQAEAGADSAKVQASGGAAQGASKSAAAQCHSEFLGFEKTAQKSEKKAI